MLYAFPFFFFYLLYFFFFKSFLFFFFIFFFFLFLYFFFFFFFFFLSLPSFVLFNSSAFFAAISFVEFIHGWLLCWLVTEFTNWSYLYFVLRCSALLIITSVFVDSVSNKPIFLSRLICTYELCQLLGDVFSTVSIFLVSNVDFLCFFLSPVNYTTAGTANAPVTTTLSFTVNSDFSIFLNLLVYSFLNFFRLLMFACPHISLSLGGWRFFLFKRFCFWCWCQVSNVASELTFSF